MATATVLSAADAAQLTTLRSSLKQWEKTFAAANGGKKAGRDDIKQHPEIAAKYKTYGRLRALEASSENDPKHNTLEKTPSKPEPRHAKTKRKYAALAITEGRQNHHSFTPRKASRRDFITPSKGRMTDRAHPADLDPYDSPSTFRRLFSPSTHRHSGSSPLPLKTAIGPTPERDGKALGLFDLLSASGGSTATPSTQRVAKLGKEAIQTPSKKLKMDAIDENGEGNIIQMGRTPASSSKRLYLERLFATPTTLRYATMVEDEESGFHRQNAGQRATEEVNPLQSETPSFLRRSNSGRFATSPNRTSTVDLNPMAVRKPPRFVGKGLSALVQGLRDMEEERMDDDWQIMRELEEDQAQATGKKADVQVGDSQMPSNDTVEDTKKTWKKRGQKRTTRLVKMRPVRSKSKPGTNTAEQLEDENEDELTIPVPPIAESQGQGRDNPEDEAISDEDSDVDIDTNEDSGSDYDEDKQKPLPAKRQPTSFSEKIKAAFSVVKMAKPANGKEDEKKGKKKSTTARKVNPDAHANYRSLKIRSRGGPKARFGGGRFGRRR